MLCYRFCQLFSDRLQFMGEGLAPQPPINSVHVRPLSTPSALPPLSLPFLPHPRQLKLTRCLKVFISCCLFTVMCTMGLHLSRSIRLKIELLNDCYIKPVIVYLQCMLRDSQCYFSALPPKSGIRYPHFKKWRVRGIFHTPIRLCAHKTQSNLE